MEENEIHTFYKLKLANDVKEEVKLWAKQSAIILAILSLVGTNILTAAVVRSFMQKDIDSLHKSIGNFNGKKDIYEKRLESLNTQTTKQSIVLQNLIKKIDDLDNYYKALDSNITSKNDLNTARIYRISKIFEESFKDVKDETVSYNTLQGIVNECYDSIYALNKIFDKNRIYNIEFISTSDIPSEFYPIYQYLVNNGMNVRNYGNTPMVEIESAYNLKFTNFKKDSINIIYDKNGKEIAKKLEEKIKNMFPSSQVILVASANTNTPSKINIGIFIN